jgi:hypothetical protein
MNYPGLQAGDGGKVLIKKALAKNKGRGIVIKFIFWAEAHPNEFCLSTPGLKARVIQNNAYPTQYQMHSIHAENRRYNCA